MALLFSASDLIAQDQEIFNLNFVLWTGILRVLYVFERLNL